MTIFVLMKRPFINKVINDSDLTTYILVAAILLTILLGSLKIIFF